MCFAASVGAGPRTAQEAGELLPRREADRAATAGQSVRATRGRPTTGIYANPEISIGTIGNTVDPNGFLQAARTMLSSTSMRESENPMCGAIEEDPKEYEEPDHGPVDRAAEMHDDCICIPTPEPRVRYNILIQVVPSPSWGSSYSSTCARGTCNKNEKSAACCK